MNGIKSLKIKGPAIITANHLCAMDVFYTIATVDAPVSFLMDSRFYHLPGLKKLFDKSGVILVDFANPAERAKVVEYAAQILAQGRVVALYPYGGFYIKKGKNLGLKRKDGIARIALRAQELLGKEVPIYPLHFEGVNIKSLGKITSSFFRKGRISVHFINNDSSPVFINNIDQIPTFMDKLEGFLGPNTISWQDQKYTKKY